MIVVRLNPLDAIFDTIATARFLAYFCGLKDGMELVDFEHELCAETMTMLKNREATKETADGYRVVRDRYLKCGGESVEVLAEGGGLRNEYMEWRQRG